MHSYAPFIANFNQIFNSLHRLFYLDPENRGQYASYLYDKQVKFFKLCESREYTNKESFPKALSQFEDELYAELILLYRKLHPIDPKKENKTSNRPRKTKAHIAPAEKPVCLLRVKIQPSTSELSKPGLIAFSFTNRDQITTYWLEEGEIKSKILNKADLTLGLDQIFPIRIIEERQKMPEEVLFHENTITLVYDDYMREEITDNGEKLQIQITDIHAYQLLENGRKRLEILHLDDGKIKKKFPNANVLEVRAKKIEEWVKKIKQEIFSASSHYKEAEKLLSDEKLFEEASYHPLITNLIKLACEPERQREYYEEEVDLEAQSLKKTLEQNKSSFEKIIAQIEFQIEKKNYFKKNDFSHSINEKMMDTFKTYAKEIEPEKTVTFTKTIEDNLDWQDRKIKKTIASLKKRILLIYHDARRIELSEKLKSLELNYTFLKSLSYKISHHIKTDETTFIDHINKNEAIKNRYTRIVYTEKLPAILNKNILYFTSSKTLGMNQYEISYIHPFSDDQKVESKNFSLMKSSIVDEIFRKKTTLNDDDIHKIATLAKLTPEYIYYHLLTENINKELLFLNSEIVKEENIIKSKKEELKESYEKNLTAINDIRKILHHIKQKCPNTKDIAGLTSALEKIEKVHNKISVLNNDSFLIKSNNEVIQIEGKLTKLSTVIINLNNKIVQKNEEIKFNEYINQQSSVFNNSIKTITKEITDFETTINDFNMLVNEYGSTYKKYKEELLNIIGINVKDLQLKLNKIKFLNTDLVFLAKSNRINEQLHVKNHNEFLTFKKNFQTKVDELSQLIVDLNATVVEANKKYKVKIDTIKKQKQNLINYNFYNKKLDELTKTLATTESKFNTLTEGIFIKKIFSKTEYLEFYKSEHQKNLKEEIEKLTPLIAKISREEANFTKTLEAANDTHPITSSHILAIEKSISDLFHINTSLSQIVDNREKSMKVFFEKNKVLKESAIKEIVKALEELNKILQPSINFQQNYDVSSLRQTETNKAFHFHEKIVRELKLDTLLKGIGEESNPSAFIRKFKEDLIDEIQKKKKLIVEDNQSIIQNLSLREHLTEIDIDGIAEKLQSVEQYGIIRHKLFPDALKLNEPPLDNPLLDMEAAKEQALLVKSNYLTYTDQDLLTDDGIPIIEKIQQMEEFVNYFRLLDERLNNIQAIASPTNLNEEAFPIINHAILDKNFKREVIDHYLDTFNLHEDKLDIAELLKKKAVIKIKTNYLYLQKIIVTLNKLISDKAIASHNHLSSVKSLLVDLHNNLTLQLPAHLCIERIEQGILKIHSDLRLNQGIFTADPLLGKLRYVIESHHALNLLNKYGSSILRTANANPPNLTKIKYVQHKGLGESLKKIRLFDHEDNAIIAFFKQCLTSAKGKLQDIKPPDFITYLKQANYDFGKTDLINLDKLTSKDKARVRIILKAMIDDDANSFIKSSQKLASLEQLVNVDQLKKDDEKFPFTCAFQRFKIAVSPNHLKTSQSRRKMIINPLLTELEQIEEGLGLQGTQDQDLYQVEIAKLEKMKNCINNYFNNLDYSLKNNKNSLPWYVRYNIFAKEPPHSNTLAALKTFKLEIENKLMKIKEENRNGLRTLVSVS